MKTLYLVHQFYPEFQAGTEKFVFNMAYMSQINGNKVKIVAYSPEASDSFPYQSDGIVYKEFYYKGLLVLKFRYEKEPGDLHYQIDPAIDLTFALKILKQEKPDIIHAGHLMRVYPFIFAAKQLNIPYILTITDFHLLCPKIILAPTSDTLCPGPGLGQNCYKFCSELPKAFIDNRLTTAKSIIQDAAAVVAPSQFVADIFESEVENLKVKISHHGIRHSNIKTHHRIYHRGDQIRFGYVGNLAIHKGVHVLINAFTGLESTTASLSIFGSGQDAYLEKLKEMAGKSRVEFLGAFTAEELGNVFNQIDVLVAPSICYETYSFVVHEALASEVPVITSNLGGMAEQIRSGNNGYRFQAGNVIDLQEKMQYILDDPPLLNKMKDEIRLVTFVPNIEQEAYRYLQVYKSMKR